MWFSRLKRRISHSEPRTLLRRVFANCTAANPPPITTTLIGFTSLLLLLAWVRLKSLEFPWPLCHCDAEKRRLDALVQDREKGILRISESCELYSKCLAKLSRAPNQSPLSRVSKLQSCQLSSGGVIPSRFILYNKVVRFRPSLTAAPRVPPSFQFAR